MRRGGVQSPYQIMDAHRPDIPVDMRELVVYLSAIGGLLLVLGERPGLAGAEQIDRLQQKSRPERPHRVVEIFGGKIGGDRDPFLYDDVTRVETLVDHLYRDARPGLSMIIAHSPGRSPVARQQGRVQVDGTKARHAEYIARNDAPEATTTNSRRLRARGVDERLFFQAFGMIKSNAALERDLLGGTALDFQMTPAGFVVVADDKCDIVGFCEFPEAVGRYLRRSEKAYPHVFC